MAAQQINPRRIACTVIGHRMTAWSPTGDQRGAVRFCSRCHDSQGWSLNKTAEPAVPGANPAAVLLFALGPILALGVAVELVHPWTQSFMDWYNGFLGI
jgi:hypothetical protein